MKKGEKLEQEIEELNEEIEKYNELIEGEEQLDDSSVKKEESTNEEENEEKISEETEMLDDIEEINNKQENQIETHSSQSTEKEELSNTKKRKCISTIIIIVLIILIISSGVLLISKLSNNKKDTYKSIDDYTEEEREIAGFSTDSKKDRIEKEIDKIKKEEEKTKEELLYTPDYIHYEQLSDEEKAKVEVIPEKEKNAIEKLDDLEGEIENVDEIPAKFNINDIEKLKIDDQGTYGLCWAFATLDSMETNHLLHKKESLDLSEMALDYLSSKFIFGNRNLQEGGNFDSMIFEGNIKGIRKEKEGEYGIYSSGAFKYLDENEQTYHITDFVSFPTIYKNNGVTDISDDELQEFRNLVKRHIMTNGSVYTVIDGSQGFFQNWYYGSKASGNHAVSIVGWDDNYSKDNFRDLSNLSDGKKPIHDGAYIIKNSWGPTAGENGYYYVSYDDQLIESNIRGVLSTDTNNKKYMNDMPNYLSDYIRKTNNYMIKKDENGDYVFDTTLKSIKSIDIKETDNINNEDLKSIFEYLPNLSYIYINNSSITDISPIVELKNLQSVNISFSNSITDYSPIGKVKSLISLVLRDDGITDISFLSELKKLKSIDLSNNNIYDISPLAGNNLSSVILENNKITDVSILKDTELDSLNLSGNKGVTGYGELQNLYSLELLGCELDKIENIKIAGYINVSNNNLTKLPNIELIEKNKYTYNLIISANNNNITDLSNLNKNYKYQSISLSDNQISDISIVNGLNATSINLSNNKIEDTSKFNNDKVSNLILSGNSNIKVRKELNNIDTLQLNNCGINSLNDISELNNNTNIYLKNNNINNLNGLDKLKKVSFLDLSNNKISSLKNTPESGVTNLLLTANDLKDLDGINSFKLLNNLDVSGNKNLKDIRQLKDVETLKYLYFDDIGEVDISKFSEVLERTEKLSISLMHNTLSGKLKGSGSILNISNSILENLDIEDTLFNNINMSNTKGNIKFEKLIYNYRDSSLEYLSIYLDDRKISYDLIEKSKYNKGLYINGGTVDYKINIINNEYIIKDSDERTVFVKAFRNNYYHNITINDKFNTITITGDNPYILLPYSDIIRFYNTRYNIIQSDTIDDAESSLYYKFVKLPIKSIFKSLINK